MQQSEIPVTGIEPVVKERVVAMSVDQAFARFTEGMATWWPMATHSVGKAETEAVVLDEGVGGRLYERLRNGEEHEWGRVTVWDPPTAVAFTWYPGRGSDTAQLVEVTFAEAGQGTRVRLVHTGWETLGADALETRNGYDGGWETVLDCYVGA